jgi:uncharacterized protein (DUF2141 family)
MGSAATFALSLAVMLSGILRPADGAIAMPFTAAAALKASPQLFTLTVVAQGVRNSAGVVGVLVFNSASGWPEQVSDAVRKQSTPAKAGETEITISNLPAGEYPVVVLHDENENEKLDRGPLGLPTEQWGMSNNPSFLPSAPPFDAARFRLTRSERLYIQLH